MPEAKDDSDGAQPDPMRLAAPLVCWLVGDVRPDGSFEPAGGALDGDAYTHVVNQHRGCERTFVGSLPRLAGDTSRAVVASEHTVPFPFCHCGLPGTYEPSGRLADVYRDRLGYRLRAVALVQLWGRLIFDNSGVHAEYGRVLALATSPDDAPARAQRAHVAAQRLGAALVDIEAEELYGQRTAFEPFAPTDTVRVTHRDFERWAHDRSTRRWSSDTQSRNTGGAAGHITGSAVVLVAFLVGIGLRAAGLPEAAAIGTGVTVGVIGTGISLYKIQDVVYCVEGFAPAPADAPVPTEPVDEQPAHPTLDLGSGGGTTTTD